MFCLDPGQCCCITRNRHLYSLICIWYMNILLVYIWYYDSIYDIWFWYMNIYEANIWLFLNTKCVYGVHIWYINSHIWVYENEKYEYLVLYSVYAIKYSYFFISKIWFFISYITYETSNMIFFLQIYDIMFHISFLMLRIWYFFFQKYEPENQILASYAVFEI